MTTEDLMNLAENYARLCYEGDDGPLVIDARQALLDALEAQGKEVERMGRQILSDTDAFIHVRDQRDTLRSELAAIRAQEPVAWMYLHAGHKELTFTDQRPVEAAHPNFAKSTPLYASPAAKDAGLVADARYQEIRESLENLMAWQVKNVKVWNHPTWDNAQAVIDRHNASPKIESLKDNSL